MQVKVLFNSSVPACDEYYCAVYTLAQWRSVNYKFPILAQLIVFFMPAMHVYMTVANVPSAMTSVSFFLTQPAHTINEHTVMLVLTP